MASETKSIRIESILGGQSPLSHFSSEDGFLSSLGIDPSLPTNNTTLFNKAGGLIRPTGVSTATATTLGSPVWIRPEPKGTDKYFVYTDVGSVYTVTVGTPTLTELADLNDAGSSSGNGCAYFDNYMYFATDTTIARYGPLNGTPAFTDDYWVTTLSKSALTNKSYPSDIQAGVEMPNHILHRHSDGRLYILDVVDNKGTIHYISTTKTTEEGDTDNGSTYNKAQVGYGLWPSAIESYGSDLAIAFFEHETPDSTAIMRSNAKIAFWDTNSSNVNKITWVEFPDSIINALKNVNGVLYAISSKVGTYGYRVSRFVGGSSFEEVNYIENGVAPLAGAVDGKSENFIFGTYTLTEGTVSNRYESACIYSVGLPISNLSKGLFNIVRDKSGVGVRIVSALTYSQSGEYDNTILFGTSTTNSGSVKGGGISVSGVNETSGSSSAPSMWRSQIFRIGQPFKITKVRIPVVEYSGSGGTITPILHFDDFSNSVPLTDLTIDGSATFVRRPDGATGQWNFCLEFKWAGTLDPIGLPVTIEYELIDD